MKIGDLVRVREVEKWSPSGTIGIVLRTYTIRVEPLIEFLCSETLKVKCFLGKDLEVICERG